MKNLIVACLIAVIVGAPSTYAQTTKKESTIIGEVVDLKSYIAYAMKPNNADRKAAAEASMGAGNPLGILESATGKVYIVVMSQPRANANEKLKEYLGLRVYVKGLVYRRAGAQLVVLNDIGRTIK